MGNNGEEEFAWFEKNMLLQGKIKSDFNRINAKKFNSINDFEFSVFSQFGEDGIIQYLVDTIDIKNKTFVEFGVENYRESNTRFLLMNNNWSGLVLDGSDNNISQIKQSVNFWKYDLSARAAFITKENINEILVSEKFTGEIGLLSIDIDGNDYWVWEEISVIHPVILVIEYNSLFGNKRHITVPYQKDFVRSNYHYSNLVYGASLPALIHLSESKGYSFVGCNLMGNNAFFVREDKLAGLTPCTAAEGFKESSFRESRDKDGRLSFKSRQESYELVKGVTVFNTLTKQIEKF